MVSKLKESKRGAYWIVVGVFLAISALMGVLCLQYYRGLQGTIKNETYEYLQELSKQIASNASRTINDNFAVLGTIANVLKNMGMTSYSELQPEVLAQQSLWNYKDVLLIDGRGTAYDAYGNAVLLSGDEYLRDAVVNRRRAMSASQVIKGTECMVFVIPLTGVTINGTEMFALAATYDLVTFDNILAMNAFSGRAYAHVVRRDGTVVVRSSSRYAGQFGYNILSSLANVKIDDNFSPSKIRSEFTAGKSGVVSYTQNDERMYMAYTPLSTREWYLLSFIPLSVVNAKSEMLMNITLILCAGITLAFSVLVAYQMLSYSRNKRHLEQIAFVDPITGGYTIDRFYERAGRLLRMTDRPPYALIYVNIERFKLLNEEFGRKACDELLTCLHDAMRAGITDRECVGRLFADNFCLLIENAELDQLEKRFAQWYADAEQRRIDMGGVWVDPVVEFGVYVITNDTLPFPHMIDRAKLALRETSTELHGKIRCCLYDDSIRRQLFREKHLENMMTSALANKEFVVHLQPRYNIKTESIGGAEALVRWMSSEGMIYPDEFIPLFEKNGFITQLDLFVFEEVCRFIRGWLDVGATPVRISVNCSRVHLKNENFLDTYREVCDRYDVSPEYIELELTESVIFENVALLSRVIDDMHAAGFSCSIDDFGSGYSSLNLIQDIPADTIKLDKVFFRKAAGKDLGRTEAVVGSVLAMARQLKMSSIAEGVEERAHVDMLKRLGCDCIQGYFFAKPMPVLDFERLAFGGRAVK